mmetsp:Transcript_11227/g.23744  ORF Transcript_11227/g.23744 Transcript_11227/m.23744 type:complete len:266 (-) Transcript_11227:784-1581(-)
MGLPGHALWIQLVVQLPCQHGGLRQPMQRTAGTDQQRQVHPALRFVDALCRQPGRRQTKVRGRRHPPGRRLRPRRLRQQRPRRRRRGRGHTVRLRPQRSGRPRESPPTAPARDQPPKGQRIAAQSHPAQFPQNEAGRFRRRIRQRGGAGRLLRRRGRARLFGSQNTGRGRDPAHSLAGGSVARGRAGRGILCDWVSPRIARGIQKVRGSIGHDEGRPPDFVQGRRVATGGAADLHPGRWREVDGHGTGILGYGHGLVGSRRRIML